MTAWDWVSVSLLAVAASCGLSYAILAWRWRVEERQAEAEQLPPPEERPDYRRLLAEIRVCPDCHGPYMAKAGFRAEESCDPCVAKRFDANVEAQKDWMRGQGWEDVD